MTASVVPFQNHENQFPALWQAAETYLHCRHNTYQVTCVPSHQLSTFTIRPTALFVTVLKVISFFTLILPLFFLFSRAIYRSVYNAKALTPQQRTNEAPTVEQSIAKFKKNFEKTLNAPGSDPIEKMLTQVSQEPVLDLEQLTQEMNAALIDKQTYVNSQQKVLQAVHVALHQLLRKPVDKDKLEFAKTVYKSLAQFLRQNTDAKRIGEYKKHLAEGMFRIGMTGETPTTYLGLPTNPISVLSMHGLIYHLLKNLRKQIKLNSKLDKVLDRIKKHSQLKKIPQATVQKAQEYLGITWLHGTQAFVIKSACEKSGGELMCMGELRKRNIQVLTGEAKEGADALGVNQRGISGVSLTQADVSISYATRYSFDLKEEEAHFKKFLNMKLDNWEHLLDWYGEFSRNAEAIRRIQSCNPPFFESQKVLVIQKLEKIDQALKEHAFGRDKPGRLFDFRDSYYPSKFYTFLKAVEMIKNLLQNPPASNPLPRNAASEQLAKIGIIVASDNKYGMPFPKPIYEMPAEELCMENLLLGKDIKVIFTNDNNLKIVQDLVKQVGLAPQIKVEPMSVLQAASQIDRALANYFYDVYNLRKWKA